MAYLKMSLRKAISIAGLLILYVTGITGAVESYAEQTARSLADVAHVCQFEAAIGSISPEWYHEGMRIFAFDLTRYFWKKRRLTWAIMNDPIVMSKHDAIAAVQAACDKWSEASQSVITFEKVEPDKKPDIRVEAMADKKSTCVIKLIHDEKHNLKDAQGVTLRFGVASRWWSGNFANGLMYFRFAVLYQMGVILGLGVSQVPGAVMSMGDYECSAGFQSSNDYKLADDDVNAIRTKYGPPTTPVVPAPQPVAVAPAAPVPRPVAVAPAAPARRPVVVSNSRPPIRRPPDSDSDDEYLRHQARYYNRQIIYNHRRRSSSSSDSGSSDSSISSDSY